jgi:DNA-binding FadR family transcriptional regulator
MASAGQPKEVTLATPRTGSSRLRIPKRAELIADSIRRDIVRGALGEGDSLSSEGELMELFQVSRPTIREAFRILESEGLIELRQGSRGARVQLPSEQAASRTVGFLLQFRGATLADIWDARIVLEPPLAGRLAKSRTRSDLAQLHQSLDQHRENLSNPEAFALATTDFHYLVVTLAGNATLSLLATLLDSVFRLHATEIATDTSPELDHDRLHKHTIRQHEKLLKLIEDGNSDEAENFWRHHIEIVADVMLNKHGATTVLELFSHVGDTSWLLH